MSDETFLKKAIFAGRGIEKADLVIKNAQALNVIDGSLTHTDIAIVGNRIVGTHARYEGKREIDAGGRVCVPGFIDTHLHIESSLVTPFEFDRCVLPHGITTAICDPHEIANVCGAQGIRYFLECSRHLVMDLRVQLSSCVPATAFETSGARLEIADLTPFADHPNVIGLAEFMNFPGVLEGDDAVLAKLAAFQSGHIDGHAPLLSGLDLNGYLAARIRTDHEATSEAEAREKLSKGMSVLIREGSVSKDLDALKAIVDADTSPFIALCTDDRNPLDIAEEGHLDHMIGRLVADLKARGVALHHAYRVASWSAATAFGLRDRGLIAPGWRADIVVLDDIETCKVHSVVAGGRMVEDELFEKRGKVAPVALDSMKAEPVSAADFAICATNRITPVIGVKPGLILTFRKELALPGADGETCVDLDQDAIKVAVVARHGINRNIGRAFVHGFGLKRGAIASSVGHDSHNICVVGANEADMAVAVNRLIAMKGGFAVADEGKVTAELALPLAGLMSLEPFEHVHAALNDLRHAARALGCTLAEPFLQVAFLPLPVIPHLKITDMGLFDADAFQLVE